MMYDVYRKQKQGANSFYGNYKIWNIGAFKSYRLAAYNNSTIAYLDGN